LSEGLIGRYGVLRLVKIFSDEVVSHQLEEGSHAGEGDEADGEDKVPLDAFCA